MKFSQKQYDAAMDMAERGLGKALRALDFELQVVEHERDTVTFFRLAADAVEQQRSAWTVDMITALKALIFKNRQCPLHRCMRCNDVVVAAASGMDARSMGFDETDIAVLADDDTYCCVECASSKVRK
jgi:hypothetical protein